MPRRGIALATSISLAAAPAAGCGAGDERAPSPEAKAARPSAAASVRTLATGLHVPWGVAFLPGGDALVSERTTGRIVRVPRDGGKPRTVMTVPGVATQLGEGGLLGLALSPGYARDGLLYAYYTTQGDNRIARFRLGATPQPILTGLHVPWGVAFLPGGDALVSERTTGRIVRVPRDGGKPRTVMTVPGVATQLGEGGLLGLALSPAYPRDGLLYAYYTTQGDNRVARFRLGATPQPILTGLRNGVFHNGGRLVFGPDGKLYVGTGEAGDPALAQDPGSANGKILRLNPDGSVPADNPFPGSPVYSLGHRNVQGLAFDRAGRLWATEFGQNERDEVNLIRPGRNYGWPVVEGVGSTRGGRFTNPQVTWSTSEASPSGAAILGSTLYVGALAGERLWRVPLRGARAGRPTALLQGRFGRLRTVVAAPGGTLWITTSNRDGRGAPRSGDDRIVRLRP